MDLAGKALQADANPSPRRKRIGWDGGPSGPQDKQIIGTAQAVRNVHISISNLSQFYEMFIDIG